MQMSGQTVRVAGVALALLAAAALVVAAVVLLTRGDDVEPVVIVAPGPSPDPEPSPKAEIRVQVSGAVVSPGVYAMTEGKRVIDVIAAAGGVRPEADLSGLNLARRVQDEAHYHVPYLGETPPPQVSPATSQSTGTGGVSAGLVDLNTADSRDLETLPGIGPVMAGRIIAHREVNGPFGSIEDVENVPGIGPKTLESLRPLVTVTGTP